jgi:hypothetical protein
MTANRKIRCREWTRHINALLLEHNIKAMPVRRWREAWADIVMALVCIPPIKTSVDYFASLHEIGHVVTMNRSPSWDDTMGEVFEREIAADVWAMEHAITPISRRMLLLFAACLQRSYYCDRRGCSYYDYVYHYRHKVVRPPVAHFLHILKETNNAN